MTTQQEELIKFIGEDMLRISCLITPREKALLQELIDLMSEQLNTSTAFSDPDGTPVLRYACFTELCKDHIRACEEGLKRCKAEAELRGKQGEQPQQPQVYKCHAGIFDFTAPILLFGRRIGNISGGQSFTKPPDEGILNHFDRYLDEIGVHDKEAAMRSVERHQVNSPAKLERIAAIYFNIGKLLSNYFEFQAEHNYWKASMLRLNAELEQRVSLRTLQLEEKMSELRRTQMQMIQQEKLVGIGQLAAGVAHEINNPLGYIISNLKTLERYVGKFTEVLSAYEEFKDAAENCNCDGIQSHKEKIEKVLPQKKLDLIKGDIRELLQDTQEGLTRIADIVQSLRIFTRVDADTESEEFDLNAGIATTLLMVQGELRDRIIVETKLGDVPKVKAIGSEMNQVLLGIILNAVQAINEHHQPSEKGVISISTRSEEHLVYCSIADNGGGIPETVLDRVFEPFFTTKPPGKGTGLGLSVAHDVITRMGGEIRIKSTANVGTEICIILPTGL